MSTTPAIVKWILFIALCFIWGSSFILMKAGLQSLSAYQVAAIRILSAGIVLIPVVIKKFKQLPVNRLKLILLSGLLGSFVPAFLFCIAETRIDSAYAGFLNALTPIFTILTGVLFFNNPLQQKKVPGVLLGFMGMLILFLAGSNGRFGNTSYALMVLIATLSYAVNANMVGRYLKDVGSVNIAAFAFVMLIIPSLIVLWVTGFFLLPLYQSRFTPSLIASTALGIMGTAVASILFYILLKRAGTLFSSMVTYGIPFIALFWGIIAGESVGLVQLTGLGVILAGVYLTTK